VCPAKPCCSTTTDCQPPTPCTDPAPSSLTPAAGTCKAISWWACCPRCHSPSTPTGAAFNTLAPTTSIAPSHRAPTSATVVAKSTSRALLLLSTSDLEASVCQRPVVFRSRSVTRSALLPSCLSALLGSVWAPAQGCQRPRARLPAGERAAGNETPVV
jgi:hypothetical protein